eukprot:TRINITY_DN7670_c0_g1_i2.p1 TRINITY_DN7670_c0_g1~~TRINITY_DN7670_c0_g1_i2.p1  ORF type:complete len:250 (-),score=60.67 TRINITY_DN7670_c0_g1_i2:232-981(-)
MAAFMLLQAGDPAYVSVATPGPPPSTLTLRHGSVLAAQAAAESSAASSVSGCHRAAGMLVSAGFGCWALRSSLAGRKARGSRAAACIQRGSATATKDVHKQATDFQTGNSDARDHVPSLKPEVTLESAQALDIRAADVKAASEVMAEVEVEHNGVMRKRKKRFLKLLLDVGSDERVIVTDLLLTMDAESAVGKALLIVANVPPELVAGQPSHGRVLLGDNYDPAPMPSSFRRQLPEPAHLPAGASISLV